MLDSVSVLEKGYVKLFSPLAEEKSIAEVATVSTGVLVKDWERLVGLLVEKKHLTPLEFIQLRWEVYAPVFVRDQIFRHRTFSFVAQSQRYSKEAVEYYKPARVKGCSQIISEYIYKSEQAAQDLLERGVPREIATRVRSSLRYSRFAMRTDLRNLLHFLDLRLAKDAQWETRQYAKAMKKIAEKYYPTVFKKWLK